MRMRAARAVLAVGLLLAVLPGGSHPMRTEVGASVMPARGDPGPGFVSPRARPASLFISGHSLTDAPYPDHLAHIIQSLGGTVALRADNPFGSTAQARAGALGASDTASGTSYDLLIMTEQHTLLGNLLWSDTVGSLRRLHQGLLGQDHGQRQGPGRPSYLFTSWLDIGDLDDPSRWIAYERAADPIWRCVAARVSHDLAAGGNVRPLPAALALAELVSNARHAHVPGIGERTARAAVRGLFRDNVHVTPLGAYYVALVSYAFVYERTPEGAWAPEMLDRPSARALQRTAWHFAEGYRRRVQAPPNATDPVSACRDHVATFVPVYLAYQRDTQWRDMGLVQRYAKWLRHRLSWPILFRRRDARNPLFVAEGPVS